MNKCLNCCFMIPALILKYTSDHFNVIEMVPWIHFQIYTFKRHKKGWSHRPYHHLSQHYANHSKNILCSILFRSSDPLLLNIVKCFTYNKNFLLWKFLKNSIFFTCFKIFPFVLCWIFPCRSTFCSSFVRLRYSVIN